MHVAVAQIVTEDEDDVRFGRGYGCEVGKRRKQQNGEECEDVFHERLIADILHRRLAQSLPQLREVKAGGSNGLVMREKRFFVGGAVGRAGAADGNVKRSGRLLKLKCSNLAIPGNTPADCPAVSGTHGVPINDIYSASVEEFARIDEKSRGPFHMGLDATLTIVIAVKHDVQLGCGIHFGNKKTARVMF